MRWNTVYFYLFPQAQFNLQHNYVVEVLADELWLKIFGYLGASDLLSVLMTCCQFYRVGRDPSLWKTVWQRRPLCAELCADELRERYVAYLRRLEARRCAVKPAASGIYSLATVVPGVMLAQPGSEYDILAKALLVGDSSVGKTALLTRWSDDVFSTSYIATIGVDFKIRTVTIDKAVVKLQMWDVAGQERFRTITRSYYRGAGLIFMCFDVTNRASFDNVKHHWMHEVERYANDPPELVIALIGCKSDLVAHRQVSAEEAVALAHELQLCGYYETTSASGDSVTNSVTDSLRLRVQDAFPPADLPQKLCPRSCDAASLSSWRMSLSRLLRPAVK